MAELIGVKGLLLDLEGTLVGDKRYIPIPGVPQWFAWAKGRFAVALQSNNTTETPDSLRGILARGGMEFDEGMVISPLTVLAEWVGKRPGVRIMALGDKVIEQAAARAGAEIVGQELAEVVVLGLTPKLTYEDLKRACSALVGNKAELWSLHYNRLYLDVDGRRGPSVGAVCKCLEYAAEVKAEILGKPSEPFFSLAEQRIGLESREILFVSDDPFSDLRSAKSRGMRTALVLCGKYPDPKVLDRIEPELRPDLILNSPADLDEKFF